MADTVKVQLSHTSKRDAEALVGRELKPINPQGGNDLYEVPADVAEKIGDIPAHPPKAEDPVSVKHFHRDLHNDSADADADEEGEVDEDSIGEEHAPDEPSEDLEPDESRVAGPGATHA
jgi:hypothetical protein